MSIYDSEPWLASYPPGTKAPRNRDATMLDVWNGAVADAGDGDCIRYFDASFGYREVDDAAAALASALLDLGATPGDRLGIFLQSDPQWMVGLLAAWKAGLVAVALNPMFKERELAHHLTDSGTTVLLTGREQYDAVAARVVAGTQVTRVVIAEPDGSTLSGGRGKPPEGTVGLSRLLADHEGETTDPPVASAGDVAILTYTSGTTGPPKGAMNTHGNCAYNSRLAADWFALDDTDTVLGLAPLFHITGLMLHMAISWQARCPVILLHRFAAAEALRLAERWEATFTVASITAYLALMNEPDIAALDLHRLGKLASGGAPISPATAERVSAVFGAPLHNVYGMTETTSPSHMVPFGAETPVDPTSGALSVGVPVPGSVSRIVDLATGEDLPAGEYGEIVVAGPMVVPGYWNQPEESANAIRGDGIHTGDVGFMDDDGWFYLVDRAKDQINAAGFKIWPREVEDVLYSHPAVNEAAVVGAPDAYRGETVVAFVSLLPGAEATEDELIAYCRERMAAYKYPRRIELMGDLPKTTSGKIRRRDLREAAAAGHGATSP